MQNETCVYFGNLEDCNCNNDPGDPGECIHMDGIEPEAPAVRCPHYRPVVQTGEGKPKYQSQIDTAYEMGQAAARTGKQYDVNRQTDESFLRICATTFRTQSNIVKGVNHF